MKELLEISIDTLLPGFINTVVSPYGSLVVGDLVDSNFDGISEYLSGEFVVLFLSIRFDELLEEQTMKLAFSMLWLTLLNTFCFMYSSVRFWLESRLDIEN